MTTLDKLQRAVERLNRAVERLSGGMGKYGFANVYNDDLRPLLSERAELLAAVERMRRALEPFALYYDLNDCDEREDDDALEVPIRDLRQARAVLTTGEDK